MINIHLLMGNRIWDPEMLYKSYTLNGILNAIWEVHSLNVESNPVCITN